MAFWRCFYHIIWATKHREPMIDAATEACLYTAIHAKSAALEAPILALNGVADHIHVALCIPPKLAVADWVRQVKGVSTREVNAMRSDYDARFAWQSSYGVLTFGAKHQGFVVAYVQAQKTHHAAGTIEPYLEQIEA